MKKTPLLLMEQVLMILIFSLAAAVCVQAFALGNSVSRQNAARDQAVLKAESLAEIAKGCKGDYAAAADICGGTFRQGALTVLFDQNWKQTGDGADAAYQAVLSAPESSGTKAESGLETALLCVSEYSGSTEPMYSLQIAWQREAAE